MNKFYTYPLFIKDGLGDASRPFRFLLLLFVFFFSCSYQDKSKKFDEQIGFIRHCKTPMLAMPCEEPLGHRAFAFTYKDCGFISSNTTFGSNKNIAIGMMRSMEKRKKENIIGKGILSGK